MGKDRSILEIIVEGKDNASKKISGVTGTLKKLGAGALKATTAVIGVATALGGMAVKLGGEAAQVERLQGTFDALNESINENADVTMQKLITATDGMVSKQTLLASTNKLISMGLADTGDKAAELTEMAVTLASAMGEDAASGLENFALMLANQSIPRLDTFGISSGKVRDRINELMEADKNLTREQAFMTAVMEQGEIAMGKVGDQTGGTAAEMARFQASLDNFRVSIGNALIPVLNTLMELAKPLLEALLPLVEELFAPLAQLLIDALMPILTALIPVFIELINAIMPLIEVVLPPLIAVIGFLANIISSILIPVISAVAGWFAEKIPQAVQFLIDIWEQYLYPAVEKLRTFFQMIAEGIEVLYAWFQKLAIRVQQTMNKITSAFNKAKKALSFMTKQSPVPLAEGIKESTRALEKFGNTYSRIIGQGVGAMSLEAVGSGGAGGKFITVHLDYRPVLSIGDEYELKNALRNVVNDINREAS